MKHKNLFLTVVFFALLLGTGLKGMAQSQTVSTMGGTNYGGANGVGGSSAVTFVVENNSGNPIILTDVEAYFQTASNGATITLWYTTTSLSGPGTIATPVWTSLATATLSVPANGVVPCFSGLTLNIPNATQYRFAIHSTSSIRYSGASPVPTPSTFTTGGVTLMVGDAQISGANVGQGGSFPSPANNPRWFTGLIKFEPANVPCVDPPTPGDAIASAGAVCVGSSVTLDLDNHTPGIGQTYQWESSPNAIGPFTSIAPASAASDLIINPTATLYYRAAVTCGSTTAHSTPVQIVTYNQLAGVYTINAGVPTGGTNFNNFTDAVNVLKCGITAPVVFNVVAASGPYNEQVVIPQIPGTSAVNTVTFNGAGNTITFNAGVTADRAIIKLDGADFITFDNLILFSNAGTFNYGFHLLNNADNNTIKNCTININTTATGDDVGGIIISGSHTSPTATGSNCDNNTIINNTITGGYYGITMYGASATRMTNNIIKNNLIREFYSAGISVQYHSNLLIDSNDITRPTRNSTTTFYGISLNNILASTVSRNTIHNPVGGVSTATSALYGIYLTTADAVAGSENIFSNNLIYDFTGSGDQFGIYNTGSNRAQYYHNTVSLEDGTHTGSSSAYGFYQTTSATDVRFNNNIVKITRGGTGGKYAIYLNTPASTVTSDRNVLFVNTNPSSINAVGRSGGTDYLTLADWQNGTGKDPNSVRYDPLFTNPATGNFTPTNSSVGNMGDFVGVSADITGAARNLSTPDAGAFEFTAPACTNPPVPGTAVASPVTICNTGSAVLDLVGNSVGAAQTYQWQSSSSVMGPFANIAGVSSVPRRSIAPVTSKYYRAAVTCGTSTAYSTPIYVGISGPLSGVYTINAAAPGSATNFVSFTDAVDALKCGISGPVTFEVAPGTYNEQIVIPAITGASATSRIRFVSTSSTVGDVTMTFNQLGSINNYILKLDGASFISFSGIAMANANTSFGRVVDIAGGSSNDSLMGCHLMGPTVTASSTNLATLHASGVTGGNIVLKNNKVYNGYYAVYINGSTSTRPDNWVLVGNTVTDPYVYGIRLENTSNAKLLRNHVSILSNSATHYCVYNNNNDDAFEVIGNRLYATSPGTRYGLFLTACDGATNAKGLILNNVIATGGGGTAASYGLRAENSTAQRYYNNSINVASGAATGAAAYFIFSGTYSNNEVKNNVFVNSGIGPAMLVTDPNGSVTNEIDYNNLYSLDTIIVQTTSPATLHTTLSSWRIASGRDKNSISYDPGFLNSTDLEPDPANAASWSVNGRGVQIDVNDEDIMGNPRITLRSAGVPDLGAYEFTPTSIPPVAEAFPANPSNDEVQHFVFGQDTVASIHWANTSLLPNSIVVRQYTGTRPPQLQGLSPSSYMYFYTDIETPGTTYDFLAEVHYNDSWLGTIASETELKLVKKDNPYPWIAYNGTTSTTDIDRDVITGFGLTSHGYFSGIDNGILKTAHISLGGKVIFCPGGNVRLDAYPSPGFAYQWKLNGAHIPGATGSSYFAPAAGLYEVEVMDGSTILPSMPVEVYVTPIPTAVVTPSGSTRICAGNSVTLAVNTGLATSYQWRMNGIDIPGAVNASYTASAAGTYTVAATNIGCSATSPATVVTIGAPQVYLGSDTVFCQSQILTLNAGNPGARYIWNTGDTTRSIEVKGVVNQSYYVKVTTGPACEATDTIHVTVQAPPTIVGISYIRSGSSYQLRPSGAANTDSYMWIFNDGKTDTARVLTYTYDYLPKSVRLVVYNACGTDTVETSLSLSVDDVAGKQVQMDVYPNPAQSQLHINLEGDMNLTGVTILNSLGQVVYRAAAENNHSRKMTLNIGDLPNGHYMLRAETSEGAVATKQFDVLK